MALADMAARQHGVVSHADLLRLGFSSSRIKRWVAVGHLHRIYRGVYAVGHRRLTWQGRFMAAALAHGDGALVSHGCAAYVWGLSRSLPRIVHVTVDAAGCAKRPGIVVARSRGRRGASELGRQVTLYRPVPHWTRSDLERAFLDLVRRAGLPDPAINTWVEEYEVDALWAEQQVIVELDGGKYHSTTAARLRDPVRDAKLQLWGYRVLRVSDVMLVHEPQTITDTLRALLRRAARTPARPGP